MITSGVKKIRYNSKDKVVVNNFNVDTREGRIAAYNARNDQEEPETKRRKLFVGEIINTHGSFRIRVTVTCRRGEFRFTQHTQHYKPVKDVIWNGEIREDWDSAEWVDSQTKSLKLEELVALMERWGLSMEEIMFHIDEATSFDQAFA